MANEKDEIIESENNEKERFKEKINRQKNIQKPNLFVSLQVRFSTLVYIIVIFNFQNKPYFLRWTILRYKKL